MICNCLWHVKLRSDPEVGRFETAGNLRVGWWERVPWFLFFSGFLLHVLLQKTASKGRVGGLNQHDLVVLSFESAGFWKWPVCWGVASGNLRLNAYQLLKKKATETQNAILRLKPNLKPTYDPAAPSSFFSDFVWGVELCLELIKRAVEVRTYSSP